MSLVSIGLDMIGWTVEPLIHNCFTTGYTYMDMLTLPLEHRLIEIWDSASTKSELCFLVDLSSEKVSVAKATPSAEGTCKVQLRKLGLTCVANVCKQETR